MGVTRNGGTRADRERILTRPRKLQLKAIPRPRIYADQRASANEDDHLLSLFTISER